MPSLQIGGYRYIKLKKTARNPSKRKYGGSRKRAARKTKRRQNIKKTKRKKQ